MTRPLSMTSDLEVLFTEAEIRQKIEALAEQISEEYKGKDVTVIGLLKGAWIFMADLVREMTVPTTCDFFWISSYGDKTESKEKIDLVCEQRININNKNVLVVEDIVDTGCTLQFVKNHFAAQNPLSLKFCTLLKKPSRRKIDMHVDYNLFDVPDKFIVGYGLDYAEKYRHLKYLATLPENTELMD